MIPSLSQWMTDLTYQKITKEDGSLGELTSETITEVLNEAFGFDGSSSLDALVGAVPRQRKQLYRQAK